MGCGIASLWQPCQILRRRLSAIDAVIVFRRLFSILNLEQAIIKAVIGQQLRMRAGLDDTAILDDVNYIGMENGGQAVGNDQRRAPPRQLAQRSLDELLAFAVQLRGRFIE